jgi:hypothetical protein
MQNMSQQRNKVKSFTKTLMHTPLSQQPFLSL